MVHHQVGIRFNIDTPSGAPSFSLVDKPHYWGLDFSRILVLNSHTNAVFTEILSFDICTPGLGPLRIPQVLHIWTIVFLGRFERSPPKVNKPFHTIVKVTIPPNFGYKCLILASHRLQWGMQCHMQIAFLSTSQSGYLFVTKSKVCEHLVCPPLLRVLNIESFGWWAHQNNSWIMFIILMSKTTMQLIAYFYRFLPPFRFFCIRFLYRS